MECQQTFVVQNMIIETFILYVFHQYANSLHNSKNGRNILNEIAKFESRLANNCKKKRTRFKYSWIKLCTLKI